MLTSALNLSMALEITEFVDGDVAILKLAGALTLGPALGSLHQAAKRVLQRGGIAGLVLDASDVTIVDSAGLGELTMVYSSVTRTGSRIFLINVPAQLQSILEITRLDALLPTTPTLEAAKQKLRQSGESP